MSFNSSPYFPVYHPASTPTHRGVSASIQESSFLSDCDAYNLKTSIHAPRTTSNCFERAFQGGIGQPTSIPFRASYVDSRNQVYRPSHARVVSGVPISSDITCLGSVPPIVVEDHVGHQHVVCPMFSQSLPPHHSNCTSCIRQVLGNHPDVLYQVVSPNGTLIPMAYKAGSEQTILQAMNRCAFKCRP